MVRKLIRLLLYPITAILAVSYVIFVYTMISLEWVFSKNYNSKYAIEHREWVLEDSRRLAIDLLTIGLYPR